MNDRILFVDDEKNVLETFRRSLRKHFELDIAEGPTSALKQLQENGPYAVVVSDLKMPRMNGIEFLEVVKSKWPETIRIMLTGHGDLDAAMSAVNQGAIFRFLTKPCASEMVLSALEDGIKQYRLVMAEKDLLRGTLRGCIQVMSELLALVSPEAFGRGEQCKNLVVDMAQLLGLEGVWRYELASMLSQIGCISLPPEILAAKLAGEKLSAEEEQIFLMHPAIAGNLLGNIPRLESVADMVAGQELPLDKTPSVGARILKIALDYTDLINRDIPPLEAVRLLQEKPDIYDQKLLPALEKALQKRNLGERKAIALLNAREGMVLAENLVSEKGQVFMEKGQTITKAAIERFVNFGKILNISEPIYIYQTQPEEDK